MSEAICKIMLEATPDGWRIIFVRVNGRGHTETRPNFDRAVERMRSLLMTDGYQINPPGIVNTPGERL